MAKFCWHNHSKPSATAQESSSMHDEWRPGRSEARQLNSDFPRAHMAPRLLIAIECLIPNKWRIADHAIENGQRLGIYIKEILLD
jgi:hypothetical protein